MVFRRGKHRKTEEAKAQIGQKQKKNENKSMKEDKINKLTEKIIGIAIDVHKFLGPGFVEKVYEKALAIEFKENKIKYDRQREIEVKYRNGILIGKQRVDFFVEDEVILELKAISEIMDLHKAQMLSYLKTMNKRIGLVLNFAKPTLQIKRIINGY